MAATVEQDCIARLSLCNCRTQRGHIGYAALGGMREGLQLHPQIGIDLRVVGPARHAHPDPLYPGLLGQSHCQPDCASSTGGLHPFDPALHSRIV